MINGLLNWSAEMVHEDSLIVADLTEVAKYFARSLEGSGAERQCRTETYRAGINVVRRLPTGGAVAVVTLAIKPLRTYSGVWSGRKRRAFAAFPADWRSHRSMRYVGSGPRVRPSPIPRADARLADGLHLPSTGRSAHLDRRRPANVSRPPAIAAEDRVGLRILENLARLWTGDPSRAGIACLRTGDARCIGQAILAGWQLTGDDHRYTTPLDFVIEQRPGSRKGKFGPEW